MRKGECMQLKIYERVIMLADYIIKSKSTVRKTAEIFGVSKSTVHNDMIKRLPLINKQKFEQVKNILNYNMSVRHIRGGNATKQFYITKKRWKCQKGGL